MGFFEGLNSFSIPCQIIEVDPEEDWDVAEEGERLFAASGIRLSSSEPILWACVRDDTVVAAIGASIDVHDGEVQFSVAVAPSLRRKGVARKLLKEFIDNTTALLGETGAPQAAFTAWVVNPHMVPLLESLGFETDCAEWSPDCPHMRLYQ